MLRDFLKGFGFNLTGGDEPHAKDFAKLLEQIKTRPDAQLLQTVMLRSLKQAQYSPRMSGTSAWRTRLTPTSPRRFGAIPTC